MTIEPEKMRSPTGRAIAEMLRERDAEIERLRGDLGATEERVQEFRSHENQTHAILGAILGTDDTLENVAKRAMARIAELEKWLKKERSARLLEKSGSILLVYLKENEIDFDEFFDGKALEHLRAEGKIGPDAKPREGLYGKYRISKADGSPVDPEADYFVLRLDTDPVARRAAREYSYMTVDRKLALDLQERITKYNPKMMDCINLQFFGVEKPRVWQITEERKAAIWHAVAVLKENDPDDEHLWDEEIAVLRAMLREAA